MFFSSLLDWVEKNPWQTVGIVAGFLAGILIILVGFWKTLFIFLMAAGGYFLGKGKDEGKPLAARIRALRTKSGTARGKEDE
jgi:uncharacterized membrane protein